MYTRETTIINKTGLHARPASEFVKTAEKYSANISIQKKGNPKTGNAKSILSVITLGFAEGTGVILTGDGSDEIEAVDALIALVDAGFGEEA